MDFGFGHSVLATLSLVIGHLALPSLVIGYAVTGHWLRCHPTDCRLNYDLPSSFNTEV